MTRHAPSRLLLLALVLILSIITVGTVFAGSAAAQNGDTSEPVVTDGTILNDTVVPGDELVVTANATDESDLIEARVRLRLTGSNRPYGIDSGQNGSFVLSKFDRSGLSDSGVQFNTTISEGQLDGTYELRMVTFIDAAGNEEQSYQSNPAYDSVEINNPNDDSENDRPDIQSVELLNDTVEPGDKVAVDVYATDASEIISISAELELQNSNIEWYYDEPFNHQVKLEVNKSQVNQDGTTRLTGTIPETQLDGEYRVDRIEVTDEFWNRNNLYIPNSNFEVDDLTVKNGVLRTDTAEPTISNVYLLNSSVQPGENLTVELIVDKNGSPIVEAEATLDHQNYYGENDEIELKKVDNTGLGETIRLTTTVPERVVEGGYRLDDYDVSITDAARNSPRSASTDFTKTVDIGTTPADTDGPQISNISVENETIQAGETVVLTANVSDQTGIESVEAVFNRTQLPEVYQTLSDRDHDANSEQIESKLSFKLTNESTMTPENGTVKLTATVPDGVFSGDYKLTSVRATDSNGAENTVGDTNVDYRYGGHLEVYYNDRISPLTRVGVSGDDPNTIDTTPPKVTEFAVLNNTVEPGSELTLSVNATDETGISLVSGKLTPAIIEPYPGVLPDEVSVSSNGPFASGESFQVSIPIPEDSATGTVALTVDNGTVVYDGDKNAQLIKTTKLVQIGTVVSKDSGEGSYTSIQPAIDNVSAGETVEVRAGTYNEEVTIDKDISLVAPDGATLNGSTTGGESTGITISSTNSISPVIDGFTIADYEQGVNATGSAGNWEVRNVTIHNSSKNGIKASDSDGDWTLANLTLTNGSGHAISADGTTGDWTVQSSTITNVTQSDTAGVVADGTAIYAPSTQGNWMISESTITNVSADSLNATSAQPEGDARQNYWGAADGPSGDYAGSGGAVVGNSIATPFYISADRSELSTPLSSTDITTLDGTNATVDFELKNDRKENNSYILNLSLPDGWTAVDYIDDGGTRQTNESKWLWQTISPGETVAPSVTVSVPEDINGTYEISGKALIEGEDVAIAQENSTVTVLNRNLTATLGAQTISNGSKTAITVEAPQTDGSFVDVTDEAVYTSNNTDIATVDANGTVTAESTGTTQLNASYEGRVATVTITVEPASVNEAIDDNDNGQIDDLEILQAIDYWQNNEAVPRTDGTTIGDFKILDLIEKWRYNTEL